MISFIVPCCTISICFQMFSVSFNGKLHENRPSWIQSPAGCCLQVQPGGPCPTSTPECPSNPTTSPSIVRAQTRSPCGSRWGGSHVLICWEPGRETATATGMQPTTPGIQTVIRRIEPDGQWEYNIHGVQPTFMSEIHSRITPPCFDGHIPAICR